MTKNPYEFKSTFHESDIEKESEDVERNRNNIEMELECKEFIQKKQKKKAIFSNKHKEINEIRENQNANEKTTKNPQKLTRKRQSHSLSLNEIQIR